MRHYKTTHPKTLTISKRRYNKNPERRTYIYKTWLCEIPRFTSSSIPSRLCIADEHLIEPWIKSMLETPNAAPCRPIFWRCRVCQCRVVNCGVGRLPVKVNPVILSSSCVWLLLVVSWLGLVGDLSLSLLKGFRLRVTISPVIVYAVQRCLSARFRVGLRTRLIAASFGCERGGGVGLSTVVYQYIGISKLIQKSVGFICGGEANDRTGEWIWDYKY